MFTPFAAYALFTLLMLPLMLMPLMLTRRCSPPCAAAALTAYDKAMFCRHADIPSMLLAAFAFVAAADAADAAAFAAAIR